MRAGSAPIAVSASRMSLMNEAGPQTQALALAGTSSPASLPLVRRPGVAWTRCRSGAWPCCRTRVRGRAGRDASRACALAVNGCSCGPRAPCTHQTSRSLRAAASWCSMDSTGVSPMPAEMSRIGPVPSSRTKSGRCRRQGPRTASSCAPGGLAGAGDPQRQVLAVYRSKTNRMQPDLGFMRSVTLPGSTR